MEDIRRFIYIRVAGRKNQVVIEMPGNQPVIDLLPDLTKTLALPEEKAGEPIYYHLVQESGEPLPPGQSLIELGVPNSTVLFVEARKSPLVAPRKESESASAGQPTLSGDADPSQSAALQTPPKAEPQVELPPSACLTSSEGVMFILGEPPILIGRSSLGHRPEIDLTELDNAAISSRQHAEILGQGEIFLLRARRTTNGTFVNDVEIAPHQRQTLHSGDVIRFGVDGVELTFWAPGDDPLSKAQSE